MPLYFAYGSNMDVEAMRARCPRSTPLGAARLARHRFFIMQGGYASVMADPRRQVCGVLWDLALGDVRALDAYEDVKGGLYRKITQPVLRRPGPRPMVHRSRSMLSPSARKSAPVSPRRSTGVQAHD
jgi:hypothetical protein